MEKSELRLYLRALGMGAVAGMRSMSAPALFSRFFRSNHVAGSAVTSNAVVDGLTSPKVTGALCALAVGELVADKLPGMPNRTQPASIVFRALSGALVGAALFESRDQNRVTGAVLGGIGAVAATYAAFHLRKAIDEHTSLPDSIVGLAEDALVIGSGMAALQS